MAQHTDTCTPHPGATKRGNSADRGVHPPRKNEEKNKSPQRNKRKMSEPKRRTDFSIKRFCDDSADSNSDGESERDYKETIPNTVPSTITAGHSETIDKDGRDKQRFVYPLNIPRVPISLITSPAAASSSAKVITPASYTKLTGLPQGTNCQPSQNNQLITPTIATSPRCSLTSPRCSMTSTRCSMTSPRCTRRPRKNYKNMTRERRVEANARERSRVHTISAAFESLRRAVPSYSCNQRLSKLAILRIAASYIVGLSRLADLDYSSDQSAPSFAHCVDQCTQTIQTEGRAKRRH